MLPACQRPAGPPFIQRLPGLATPSGAERRELNVVLRTCSRTRVLPGVEIRVDDARVHAVQSERDPAREWMVSNSSAFESA